MRRQVLRSLLGLAALGWASSTLSATQKAKTEPRLIGTWRSDKERTLALWKYKNEVSPETRSRIENLFGKFTLRFTRTHIHTEFEGETSSVRYSVIASDKNSVVIAWHEEEGPSLQHIHFESESYYVVSGYNVEFFTRVRA
mgnify:CR=1 FL=1